MTDATRPMTDATAPRVIDQCRICGTPALEPVLNLGPQYVSDFPNAPDSRPYDPVPLAVVRCLNPHCGLVQLTHTTPRDWLYRQYWYRSGVTEAMRAELSDIVGAALRHRKTAGFLLNHATVGDIGANDGTLLEGYPLHAPALHLIRVAWEPARNLYQVCRPACAVLFPDFFEVKGAWTAEKIEILTSIAMFYDLDQPQTFVRDVTKVLAPKGVWCVQQAYLLDMLTTNGYDNVGHEHLEYYHLKPLEYLLAAQGLEVFHVERRAINAGSFRTWIGWKGVHRVRGSVAAMRTEEAAQYADPVRVWRAFQERTAIAQEGLRGTLQALHVAGKTIDLLGASTKGNTLLQACGVDHTLVRRAWERSPEKVGRYVGVTGIPIVDEETGRADPPDVLLATPWQFRGGLVRREASFLKSGRAILFPLPTVEMIRTVDPR
jgi:hypothetical protein